VLGLLFYANSFSNEYAFDDGIVILKNQYVQDGFKGIPKIVGNDAYDSFYRQLNAGQQFSGVVTARCPSSPLLLNSSSSALLPRTSRKMI